LAVLGLCIIFTGVAQAACTSINSLPTNITASGTYCMTGNVSKAFTANAITVSANNVTIDLAGFTINQTTIGAGNGLASDGYGNIQVKNGRFLNFRQAITMNNGNGNVIDNIYIDNGYYGIYMTGSNAVVKNCTVKGVGPAINVESVGGYGQTQNSGSRIVNNDVMAPGSEAIYVGQDDIVIANNRLTGPGNMGIFIDIGKRYLILDNQISNFQEGINGRSDTVTSGTYRGTLTSGNGTNYSLPATFLDAGQNN